MGGTAGTVQFYVNGQQVGHPRRLVGGRAFLPLFGGGGSVTAVYSSKNRFLQREHEPAGFGCS